MIKNKRVFKDIATKMIEFERSVPLFKRNAFHFRWLSYL